MSGLANLQKTISNTITIDDTVFEFTIYPNPHKKIPTNINNMTEKESENYKELQNIISVFGNRIQGNTHCLNITEKNVTNNINNQDYLALIFVKNSTLDDTATGSLQYWNWCESDPKKQTKNKKIWINDLCRINNSSKLNISPIKALFKIISNFCINHKIYTNYLMVDTDKPGTNKLKLIYSEYGYKIDESCNIPDSIVMKKHLISGGSLRKTRKKN